MMWMVLVVCAVGAQVEGSLAPFVTRCHESDTSCHVSSAQKALPVLAAGIPELQIKPLDPMEVPYVKADEHGLTLEFKDTVVKGLRNCRVLALKRRAGNQSIELSCSVTLVGDYVIDGQLLIMSVQGSGKYKIKIRDIVVKVTYEVPPKTVGDQQYWSLAKWNYSTQVKTGVEFHFQNLFNGDQNLADPVLKFANNNWRDIFDEVSPPIVKAIVTKIVQEVAKFFRKVPISDLALD